jgi:hypothetical protein
MYMVFCYTSLNDAEGVEFDEMKDALAYAKLLRDSGCRYVTMVSENPNVVGRAGVDAVINGKLPDGSDYTWKKRRI